MREPRDMEGPVERKEALAAKELRKAKAASAERLCVAPRNGRKPLSVEFPRPNGRSVEAVRFIDLTSSAASNSPSAVQ